jgi:sulfur relay (sulfurtransferase) complex TusBCD TusD component (DsrE family)
VGGGGGEKLNFFFFLDTCYTENTHSNPSYDELPKFLQTTSIKE